METADQVLELIKKTEQELTIKLETMVNEISTLIDNADFVTIAEIGTEISLLSKSIDKISWGISALEEHFEVLDSVIKSNEQIESPI